MSGIKKTVKKITSGSTLKDRFLPNPFDKKAMEKSFLNPVEVLSESVDDLGSAFTPDIPEPEEQTIIPIPSSQLAETQSRKRRAKSRSSGRSSTILTEGLGG